jgi:hypothetical protein
MACVSLSSNRSATWTDRGLMRPSILCTCVVVAAAFVATSSRCGGSGSPVRSATTSAVKPRLNSVALLISVPGARANKLIACLRTHVDASELKVFGPRNHLLVVGDLRGRSDRALRRLLGGTLTSCDPRWRQIAAFLRRVGPRQYLEGHSP